MLPAPDQLDLLAMNLAEYGIEMPAARSDDLQTAAQGARDNDHLSDGRGWWDDRASRRPGIDSAEGDLDYFDEAGRWPDMDSVYDDSDYCLGSARPMWRARPTPLTRLKFWARVWMELTQAELWATPRLTPTA